MTHELQPLFYDPGPADVYDGKNKFIGHLPPQCGALVFALISAGEFMRDIDLLRQTNIPDIETLRIYATRTRKAIGDPDHKQTHIVHESYRDEFYDPIRGYRAVLFEFRTKISSIETDDTDVFTGEGASRKKADKYNSLLSAFRNAPNGFLSRAEIANILFPYDADPIERNGGNINIEMYRFTNALKEKGYNINKKGIVRKGYKLTFIK